jgi:hypothetical protein
MIIRTKRKYQDTASIREPGRCHPGFCDEPIDQISRDPKLVARRNQKFFSHFRFIGRSVKARITASRASASAQSSSGGRLPLGNNATKSKAELGPQK